jgi:threonine/homoserine/homoserine lactone efflux protein
VFVATLLFPVAAVTGLVTVVRVPRAELERVLRAYALVTSSLNVVTAAYLAWWGVLGWRSWG